MSVERTVSLREEIDENEERMGEIRDEASDLDTESDDFEELDAEFRELKRQNAVYERCIDDYGGSDFVVKELTFGETMRARDEVNAESYDMDPQTRQIKGVPRDGLYKVRVLELGVVDLPPDAPEPKSLNWTVAELLYDEVDDLTIQGGADIEDFSLQSELES